MNKQKFLFFSSRIPENDSAKAGDLISMIRLLQNSYKVSYVVFQSLFTDESTLKVIKRSGADLVDFKKYDRSKTFDQRMAEFFEEDYSFIMFDSVYTAKYYMPFIYMYSPSSLLLMDARHSQYYIETEFASRATDDGKRATLMEKSKISREREIPLYNYFDLIIAAGKKHMSMLVSDVPNIHLLPVERPEDFTAVIDGMSRLEKKNIYPLDVPVAECAVSLKERSSADLILYYNQCIIESDSEYILFRPKDVSCSDNAAQKLIFCMKSHPDIAVVSPVSDGFLARTTNSKAPDPSQKYNFSEFLKKHYIGNFAQWRKFNFLQEYCFMINRNIVMQTGVMDDRFDTLEYALMDMGMRIRHAGYRIVCDQEVFVYYGDLTRCSSRALYSDQRLLLHKWGIDAASVLEGLSSGC